MAIINSAIREFLGNAIKNSTMSRIEIAERLNETAGFPASIHMLNDWCASSKNNVRFPLAALQAFCEIVGSEELALLALPESLRENAKLGEVVRPIIEKWAAKEREKQRAKQPRKKGGSK